MTTLLSDDDVGLGSTGTPTGNTPDGTLLSDDDVGVTSQGSSGLSPPSEGSPYRPGPGFSAAGDLWNLATGQKPQNVVSTNAKDTGSDTRPWWVAAAEDVPGEVASAAGAAWQGINNNLNPVSTERQEENAKLTNAPGDPSFFSGMVPEAQQTLGVGSGLLSIPQVPMSLPVGVNRSVTGHALAASGLAQNYEQGKDEADLLLSAIGPKGFKGVSKLDIPSWAPPDVASPYSPSNLPIGNIPTPPLTPTPGGLPGSPVGPFGVVRTQGDLTGDIGDLQTEQAARQGDMGPAAQRIARASDLDKEAKVAAATGDTRSSLDTTGQTPIDSAQQSGNLISQSLQKVAKASEDNVDAKYDAARSAPGAFDSEALNGVNGPAVADAVESRVAANPNNIQIDPSPGGLTPAANAALTYLRKVPQFTTPDETLASLLPEDLTKPTGTPNLPSTIPQTPVSLQDINQVRRNLLQYKSAGYANSPTDGAVMSSLVNAFDDHVANLGRTGAFQGPQTSLDAWNTARAANAAHQETFGVGKSDPVGQTIQNILGTQNKIPMTGNDLADKMFGASGTNPTTTNLDLVQHLQGIFGADSPEMASIKQGQFARLTGEGQPWTHDKVSKNIDKFLNRDGREMANTVYSPAERSLIQSYGDMRQELVPKKGVMNPMTAPYVNRVVHAISSNVAAFVGAALGHHFLPEAVPEVAREAIGAGAAKGVGKVQEIIQARKISRMMPTTLTAIKQWEKAAAKASRNYAPDTARALTYTSGRLANTLAPMGVSLKGILSGLQGGPVPGYTQPQNNQNQQPVPGPGDQQPAPGNPGSQQGFAKGGAVKQKLKIVKHGYRLQKARA